MDIHLNPGPRNKLSIIHWNVNSLSHSNFSRKVMIEALNTNQNFDVIAITETGLHQNTDSANLEIDGFSLFRRNLPDTR